jgi:translocon-associated protein subunit alpha
MARSPWCTVLVTLLLASALLFQAFVTPVVSSEVEDDETPKTDAKVAEEPVPVKVVEANLKVAPGVEASAFFPKNPSKVVKAGEPTQVDIDISNDGAASLKVAYVRATLHLPHDHRLIVQNFTVQEDSSIVSTGSKASINYLFSINKFLQPGSYDFVGLVVYEVDNKAYKNVFHNGTIDVVEAGFFVKGETVFLLTLGLGLLGLLGMWAYSKVQEFIKKQKRSSKKVETGTRTSSDAHTSEWLQGTSFNQKASRNIAQQRKAPRKKSSGSGNFSS